MASILFSYADSDQPEARRLSAALERAGHKIVGGLQDADVVLVIWSSAALSSPYIHERAAVALDSHCLVQVVTANFDAALLPDVFRAHAKVPAEDTNAVIEEVTRVLRPGRRPRLRASLEGPDVERQKENGRPPRDPDELHSELRDRTRSARPTGGEHVASGRSPVAARAPAIAVAAPLDVAPLVRSRSKEHEKEQPADWDELALSLDDIFEGETAQMALAPPPIPRRLSRAALERRAGQLIHRIPDSMRVGKTEVVEVRLGRAHQDMTKGLMGSGDLTVEDLPIVETMTVDLYGSPGAFKIVRQSRATQLVKSSLIWSLPPDEMRFGRWAWHVTPKKRGAHELVVKISADLSDSRGVATTEPYEDRTFSVRIRVNYAHASVLVLKWSAAGAVSALGGASTQEIWWPKLKALLLGTGLLG
jgi:hypothetical protein